MIQVAKETGWVTWVFVTLDGSGNPFAPTVLPSVQIFRVDPNSGSLALDVNINPSALMTVTAVAGAPIGTYAATAKFDTALFEQYWLVGQYVTGIVTKVLVECLILSNADQQTLNQYRAASGTISSQVFPLRTIPGGT